MKDPYLYDDAEVLINLGSIRDEAFFKTVEADITGYTMAALYSTEFAKFDSRALLEVHWIIFGDLYQWAGQIRTIQISKSEYVLGGDTVRYTHPKEIKKELAAACKEVSTLRKVKDQAELISRIARLSARLWQIHPFREGNTRAVVAFSVILARSFGIEVRAELFKKNAAYVRNALVWASQGVYSKFEYLERIYFDAMGDKKEVRDIGEEGDQKYSVINGYYVADQKEAPHKYSANQEEC